MANNDNLLAIVLALMMVLGGSIATISPSEDVHRDKDWTVVPPGDDYDPVL